MNLKPETQRLVKAYGGDCTEIYKIFLNNQPITNLGGLEDVPNLRELTLLLMSSLTNIEALVNVPKLHRLILTFAPQLTNIEPLEHLSTLKVLDLTNTGIVGIRGLRLPLLEQLDLGGTQVQDISPIINFPELTHVSLYDMPIRDYDPLLSLPKLEFLVVSKTCRNASWLNELEKRGVTVHTL
jgi:Leucine-rich repeat (LRR) protein